MKKIPKPVSEVAGHFAELPLITHMCEQVCVQPILYPIHVGHSPCRHLAQIRHSKIFVRSPCIPCFQILPQAVPSLPEKPAPTSPAPLPVYRCYSLTSEFNSDFTPFPDSAILN